MEPFPFIPLRVTHTHTRCLKREQCGLLGFSVFTSHSHCPSRKGGTQVIPPPVSEAFSGVLTALWSILCPFLSWVTHNLTLGMTIMCVYLCV